MDASIILVIMIAALVVLMGAGFHVAFCMATAGILGLFFLFEGNLFAVRILIWQATNSDTLMVIAFFVLMGEVLLEAKLSGRLYEGANRWVGRLPGSLLHVNIVAATIFAACTGSSTSTAATLGRLANEEGRKRKYSIRMNLGSMAGAATLGILIPPSVILILYGVITENSIGQLYMAGFFPGLMLSFLFMFYTALTCLRRPELAPLSEIRYTWWQKLAGLWLVTPMLIIIFTVLGVIYLGVATPNEAGAGGALMSIVLGFAYRTLSRRDLVNALGRTAQITSMVLFLIIGAGMITNVLANSGAILRMIEWVKASGLGWNVVLVGICVLYLILGCFFDSFSILILTLPFVYPLVVSYNFDPILFGIVVTILIETGLITPPYGINLYVLDGVAGGGQMGEIIRGAFPYFLILLVGIALVILFPKLALWLPSTMIRPR